MLSFYCKRVYVIPKQIRLLTVYLIGYIIVIGSFVAFVYVNGSIVVGDKSAHEAALHLPQVSLDCSVNRRLAISRDFLSDILFCCLRHRLCSIHNDHSLQLNRTDVDQAMVFHYPFDVVAVCHCSFQHPRSSLPPGRQPPLHFLRLE